MIIPNKLIRAFFKRSKKVDTTMPFNGLENIKTYFGCHINSNKTCSILLENCYSDGRRINDKWISYHKTKQKGNKNLYIGVISYNSDYRRNLFAFFRDYHDYINFDGYTYFLSDGRYVVEFNDNFKIPIFNYE